MKKIIFLLFLCSPIIGRAQLPSSTGWSQIPNMKLSQVCIPSDCGALISAWSGGIADISRNQLVIFGGGHTDSGNNGVYAYDLNTQTMKVLQTASSTTASTCVAANPDGTPNARHTYGGLQYDFYNDVMWVYGGSLSCSAGSSVLDTWKLNLANGNNPTANWHRQDPVTLVGGPAPDNAGLGNTSGYDPISRLIYNGDNTNLWSYNVVTNTYTELGGLNPSDFRLSGVVDYQRHLYFIFGDGVAMKADINPLHTYSSSTISATNCGAMKADNYPGLAFDPVNKVIVGYSELTGGNTVFVYNPDTDSCTQETYAGGPVAQPDHNGTFGRFQYFPNLGVFAIVTDWQQNLFILRRQTATASALQDFNNRAGASGIVLSQNFDTSAGFQQGVNIFPNTTFTSVYPAQDTTQFKSGTSSMRIDVPPFQGANMGEFATTYTNIGGSGATIWFQVATRISPEMLSNFNNPTYHWPTWKNHSFFNGTTSCTGQMVVTGIESDGLIPIITTGPCSNAATWTNGGVPPFLLQQGDYNCPYRGETPTLCWYWPSNVWVTFTYHIKLGTLNGSGDYPGSTVEVWVSQNSLPPKKIADFTATSAAGLYYFVGDGPTGNFNHLELLPYMTGKDDTIGGYPTAHTWWDELLVSTQPIAFPFGPTLTAVVTAPVASFTPSNFIFPAQLVGTSSSAVPITLTNIGTATMNISSIGFSGANSADYSQNNNCGASLAQGSTCTINVTFTPLTNGLRIAAVSVASNTATSPDTMTLSGPGSVQIINGVGSISGNATFKVNP